MLSTLHHCNSCLWSYTGVWPPKFYLRLHLKCGVWFLQLCFEGKMSFYGLDLWSSFWKRLRIYLNFSYLLLTQALLDFCTAKQTSCQHCSFPTVPLRCKLIKVALAVVPACSCPVILSTQGLVPTAEWDLLGITASSVVCPAAHME